MVLGASLGGAAAIDFALAYPESVLKLVRAINRTAVFFSRGSVP